MPFSPQSPGVYVSEIDLTPSVPSVSVSTGGFAGIFNWGPVLQVTPVSSEHQLASAVGGFGYPDNNTATSFFSCTSFLSYSNNLKIVRAPAANANNACANGGPQIINNSNDYFNNVWTTYVVGNPWTARYPGALGNSLKVYVWASNTAWTTDATNANSPNYLYANQFPFAPNTSPWLQVQSGNTQYGDELHVLVVDTNGQFTGVANTILERYQGLSRVADALTPTGANNYYRTVLYNQSNFIYNTGVPAANVTGWGVASLNWVASNNDVTSNNVLLTGGKDGTIADGNIEAGWGLFANVEQVDVGLLFVADQDATVTNYVFSTIAGSSAQNERGDCVAFFSPPLANVLSNASPVVTSITNYANGLSFRSSYGVMDSGWKWMYDKYNDVYRWIPLNTDIAGLCAQTDNVRDPWWSPAGLQRGLIKNAIKLAYNPGFSDRNTLYSAGINPVVSFPGQGTMLFGDKTFLNYASAFDRINVRRLFIVLEKAISQAARTSLFEFNDAFTRSQFINLVTPFLTTVKGRRGITNFQVVCDQTNNTPAIINAHQFQGDIYIVPNYSINYIQLNFIAVQNGVNFNTIVGQF